MKDFVYIRDGIICRGDDAIKAKEEVNAKKLANELKSSLESIAASTMDPITPNDIIEDCNGTGVVESLLVCVYMINICHF